MFYKDERLALFIDGQELHRAAAQLEFSVDFKRLIDTFKVRGRLLRSYYYTVLPPEIAGGQNTYVPLRPLVDWLEYNGFAIRKRIATDGSNRAHEEREKLRVNLMLEAIGLAHARRVEHVVLFLNSGAYLPLVEALKREGVRVTLVSTIKTNPPVVDDELRRAADWFVDLHDLRDEVEKERSNPL